jgi:hypothetical protein
MAVIMFSGPNGPQPSGVLAHTYEVKNVYTGLMRGFAAYYITNPQLYYLALASFVGVLWLYGTETFYYRTVNFDHRGSLIPLIQASGAVLWIWCCRGGITWVDGEWSGKREGGKVCFPRRPKG